MKRREWLHKHLPGWAWDNLATALFVVACGVLAVAFYLIVSNNNSRINDIQQSRVESCRATYLNQISLFAKVIPASQKRTSQWQKFVNEAHRFADRCGQQTQP